MKNLIFKIVPLLVIFLFSGCSKDDEESFPFTIQVTTPEGLPVQNAFIKVDAPVAPDRLLAEFEGRTDMHGEITFRYSYPAVLKIRAMRSFDGIIPLWIGCGFVKLESNQNVRARVVVRPFDPNIGGC
jgi:hypothetical protein